MSQEEVASVKLPQHEPQPVSMHEDMMDPKHPVGYSTLPMDAQVLALSRDLPLDTALDRAYTICKTRGLRIISELYYTPRYWFWRVVCL